jgi:hypothetical protein
MPMKNRGGGFLIFAFSLLFLACGIDDFPLIDPIPQSNSTPSSNNFARVRIPNIYQAPPFTHFEIYYRIYVSGVPEPVPSPANFSVIHPLLATNYNSFAQLINSTTPVTINMNTRFTQSNYHMLNFEDYSISDVLGSSVWGRSLVFNFATGRVPEMSIEGTNNTYILNRASGVFSPRPNLLFRNSDDLWNSEYLNPQTNADVQGRDGLPPGAPVYTFAAMYIVAVGMNYQTFTPIYSAPALIHVFLLPN